MQYKSFYQVNAFPKAFHNWLNQFRAAHHISINGKANNNKAS